MTPLPPAQLCSDVKLCSDLVRSHGKLRPKHCNRSNSLFPTTSAHPLLQGHGFDPVPFPRHRLPSPVWRTSRGARGRRLPRPLCHLDRPGLCAEGGCRRVLAAADVAADPLQPGPARPDRERRACRGGDKRACFMLFCASSRFVPFVPYIISHHSGPYITSHHSLEFLQGRRQMCVICTVSSFIPIYAICSCHSIPFNA
jgi:hypothetical protein